MPPQTSRQRGRCKFPPDQHHARTAANGTIYLPGGRLLIDAPVKVAEESDYTVMVVNRLDLAFGPTLVLNSNYARSRVPVPEGYGPIGARNVQLVR